MTTEELKAALDETHKNDDPEHREMYMKRPNPCLH